MLDPPHGLQLLLSRLCSQISDPLYCLHPILLATSAVVFAGARLAALLAVASLAAPHGVLVVVRLFIGTQNRLVALHSALFLGSRRGGRRSAQCNLSIH
jgi:hypothetical protein